MTKRKLADEQHYLIAPKFGLDWDPKPGIGTDWNVWETLTLNDRVIYCRVISSHRSEYGASYRAAIQRVWWRWFRRGLLNASRPVHQDFEAEKQEILQGAWEIEDEQRRNYEEGINRHV